ncbi:MIR motif-containing protein [Pilaira anomala]|nr:MIR motif-containing protein [Pilaira anomala]
MSQPQDGIVRFGNHISLKHVATGRYLASIEETYDGGSFQQKVFTVEGSPSEQSTWIVIPPTITDEEAGYEVGFEDEIRLKRVTDRSNLHSHEVVSPVSGQQEVSCFGDDENTDENDMWRLEQFDNDEESEDHLWHVGQPVIIRHVATGKLLHSHEMVLADDQYEVTAFDGPDENDKWVVCFD